MSNRPDRYNAVPTRTVDEMIKACRLAWANRQVRALILTGAGDKAFCTGGDVKQRAETGDYGLAGVQPGDPGLRRVRVHRRLPGAEVHADARVMTLYEGSSQSQKLLIDRAETGINAFE